VSPSKGKQRPKNRPVPAARSQTATRPKAAEAKKSGRAPAPRPAPGSPRGPSLPAWPTWVWLWIAAIALIFFLRAVDVLQSVPLCVFLSAVAGALCFSFDQLTEVGPAHPLLRFRQITLVAVVVAMPSLFDPSTDDVDDLPRLVILVVAAVLILATWAVDATATGWRPRRLVNGFQWVLGAIVVWFGVTTLTSVEVRQSFIGRYGTYEGFLLVAALAVIAAALSEAFTLEALPALFRVVVASAVPALVYGAIQFYGYDVHKHSNIDFVQWSAAFHNVFASFGNPNHFGGFLVTVLPLGVVTAVLARTRWLRIAVWVWVAVLLVLVLQTAARGAWLGGLAGGAVLVAGLLPRLRARAGRAWLVAGGAVVIAVALIAGGSRFLGAKASALLKFGSGSSVSQRYGYWKAALHIGLHHPVVGSGPDTYAVIYTRYQSASLAKVLGASFFVNGAHNIFLSWLANEGIPGFLLILALFAIGVVWGIRGWRMLRTPVDSPTPAPPTDSETHRYLVVGLTAALVAYFVQACFDVEQVATLFTCFLVVGLLGVLNRGLWPRAWLLRLPFGGPRPGTDSDGPPAEDDPTYPTVRAPVSRHGRSANRARDDLRRVTVTLVVAALGLTAVGLTYWRMDAMWRADHLARTGTQATVTTASQLNPWQPTYFQTLGEAAGAAYANAPTASDAPALLHDALAYISQAVALDGENSFLQQEYADLLATEGIHQHSSTVLHAALARYHLALQEDPYNAQATTGMKKVETALASQ
jgi:O-antigen ligase